MFHLTQDARESLHRAKISKKSLEGINAEFLDYRQRLKNISTVAVTSYNYVSTTRDFWLSIARHQRDFVETMVAGFPSQGPVQAHILEVEMSTRHIRALVNDNDEEDAAHRRISKILLDYVNLLWDIENDCQTVERAYCEKVHYEHKVDKLEKKAAQKSEALQRNKQKLVKARDKYDTRLSEILADMHWAYAKHEIVLQCAHYAFWMANQAYSATIHEVTHAIRKESMAAHQHLLNIDVYSQDTLVPIPRPYENRASEFENSTTKQVAIENMTDTAASSSNQNTTDSFVTTLGTFSKTVSLNDKNVSETDTQLMSGKHIAPRHAPPKPKEIQQQLATRDRPSHSERDE